MKKALFFLFLTVSILVKSQAPHRINYQGVARNSGGNFITTPIGIKFQIYQGSVGGTLVYEETNNATPSSVGVFTVHIGAGAATTGTFSAIGWGSGPYFLQVSIDPAGGTSYSTVGANELISVPYALFAEKAGNAVNYNAGNGISISSGSITNAAPDQTVNISAIGIATVTNAYPNFSVNVGPPSLTYNTGTKELTLNQGGTSTSATLTGTGGSTISMMGTGIASVTPTGAGSNFTVNVTPPVILGQGATSVAGAWPSFTISSPASTNYIQGSGISIAGNTITNTAPNQTVNITGTGPITVSGGYPNYTISAPVPTVTPPPNIIGAGITNVTNAGNNYTVSTPPVNMTYMPGTGILSYSQAIGPNTVNINPALTFTNGTLGVGANTVTIPGAGLWSKLGGATYLSNTLDNVGIGINTPAQNLHVQGFNSIIRVQSTQSTTAANSMIEFGNTISSAFNTQGRIGNPGSGDHMEYDALTFHRFTTQGTERMRITNTGSVGIGNFTPFSLFDVSGKITMRTGAVNGYIPVSDANGTMTWTNPTSVIPQLWSLSAGRLSPTTITNSVGIGTATPGSLFEVLGSASSGMAIQATNTISGGISGGVASFDNLGARSIGNTAVVIKNYVTKAGGSNSTKVGLEVNSTGSWGPATVNQPNIGIKVVASGADNNYALQLIDGTQGAGKVLTSDASGNGTWNYPLSPMKAGSAGGLTILNNAAYTYPAGTILTITPAVSGTVIFNFTASYNFDISIASQVLVGLYINTTGVAPNTTTNLTTFTKAGWATPPTGGGFGDIPVSVVHAMAVVAGTTYYVWFGANDTNNNQGGNIAFPKIVATLHQTTGL